MRDLQYLIDGLDQRASGEIEITDYTLLFGVTITVDTTDLVEGVDFDAETDNSTTATNLATAIDGISGVSASADDVTVNIFADTSGVAGNSIVLVTNATDGITLSGATLEGGVDAIYSDVLDLSSDEGLGSVEASIYISAFEGAAADLTITLQYSYDKSTWFDDTASNFTVIDSGTSLPFEETKKMTFIGIYVRFKVITTGVFSGKLFARGVEDSESGSGSSGGDLQGVIDAINSTSNQIYANISTTNSKLDDVITNTDEISNFTAQLPDIRTRVDLLATEATIANVLTQVTAINADLPAVETAGADGVSNTSDRVSTSSRLSVFNGSTWDRLRSALVGVQTGVTGILNVLSMGRYNTTPPTLSDGNTVISQMDVRGNTKVSINDGVNQVSVETAGTDATSNTQNNLTATVRLKGYNGTTWDRLRSGITAVTSTLTGWLNTLPWAIFNATPTTRTEGQGGPLQTDNAGSLNTNPTKIPTAYRNLLSIIASVDAPTIDSGLSWDSKCSTALENKNLVKNVACQFKGIAGYIDSTMASGSYYLQIWDRASEPAPGTAISANAANIGSIPLTHTNGVNTLINPADFPTNGKNMVNGCFIGLSSTPFTYNAVVGSFCNFTSIRTK